MKEIFTILCLTLLSAVSVLGATVQEALFVQASFDEVKARAAHEGKLFFVDFYADYCYNCKLMDETTFVDPLLKRYAASAYLPIKVHLEDFDGITLQQTYGIRVLPTILVFNSSGELIDRYEEALSGSQLLLRLKQHDIPANRIRKGGEAPLAAAPTPRPMRQPGRQLDSPSSSLSFADNSGLSANAAPTQVPGIAPTPLSPVSAPSIPVSADPAHLFQFSVSAFPTQGYGIQVGVFGQYGNVLREVEKLQQDFKQPVLVNISTLNGKTVYNVIVGSFETRRSASAFRRLMRKQDYRNTMVKDLSKLKS